MAGMVLNYLYYKFLLGAYYQEKTHKNEVLFKKTNSMATKGSMAFPAFRVNTPKYLWFNGLPLHSYS